MAYILQAATCIIESSKRFTITGLDCHDSDESFWYHSWYQPFLEKQEMCACECAEPTREFVAHSPPLGLSTGFRANTPVPWLLHSADAASGEAMAPSTAGMQAAGWFLLAFVRSEQTRETLLRLLPKARGVFLTRKLIFKSPQG